MSSPDEKIIYLSKMKIILLTGGAVMFVALGAWLLSTDDHVIENYTMFSSPTLIYGIGLTSIVFFGLCGAIGVKKLFDRSPGLVINDQGILDNSSGVAAGFIPWSEIIGIDQYEIHGQKFVSILVQDPDKYVDGGNALKRLANKANLSICGTPINISANALEISYDDLLKDLEDQFRKYRDGSHQ